jgi:hypothetical protein
LVVVAVLSVVVSAAVVVLMVVVLVMVAVLSVVVAVGGVKLLPVLFEMCWTLFGPASVACALSVPSTLFLSIAIEQSEYPPEILCGYQNNIVCILKYSQRTNEINLKETSIFSCNKI